jgi:DNA polymerase elongation subunit (family B)
MQKHWKKKSRFVMRLSADEEITDKQAEEAFQNRAGIFAEFGKIICISIGYILEKQHQLRIKSFYGDDEKEILGDFTKLISKHYHNPDTHFICGHNIKEFDIPYLCRRLVINKIGLPPVFQLAGKKPWETKHLLDTMELWKFGDIKNYTSLDLLAAILGIETPKEDIDGSMVGHVYWQENDLERIKSYCEKDVVTVAQILLRLKGQEILNHEQITSV